MAAAIEVEGVRLQKIPHRQSAAAPASTPHFASEQASGEMNLARLDEVSKIPHTIC